MHGIGAYYNPVPSTPVEPPQSAAAVQTAGIGSYFNPVSAVPIHHPDSYAAKRATKGLGVTMEPDTSSTNGNGHAALVLLALVALGFFFLRKKA